MPANFNNIQLTEEKETLFITLCAKAIDFRSKNSILNDSAANDLVKKAQIEIEKYANTRNRINVVRAKQLDEWTKDFIAKNQNTVVVYLGCGLDTRVTRIKPPAQVTWFDVDYPEVIDLRKTFYSDSNTYKMIGSSLTAPNWLEDIPADRPALVIAEGVLEYLSEEEVKSLFSRLINYFLHGQLIFDMMNSFAIHSNKKKLKKTTGAVLKWAVDDVNEVDKLNLQLKRVNAIPLFKSAFMKKIPFALRSFLSLVCLFPKYKNMIQLMRYDF